MPIVRFDPMRSLMRMPDMWEDWERLANDSTLPVDVYETENAVVVKMPMPGVKPDDIDISITGDTVTVKGEHKQEHQEEDRERSYYFREIRRGSFARSVTLPAPVQANQAEATTENGVLTLNLPKAEEAKPRSIKVKSQDKQE